MTLDLTLIRELTLSTPKSNERTRFLYAASGLIRIANRFYVVADDELSLGVFDTQGTEPGELFRLFPGDLPEVPRERKRHKPDLEAVVYLGPQWIPPLGAILAIPSGSTPDRFWGALIALQANGVLVPNPPTINFGRLYQKLLMTFPNLNIEGAVVVGSHLKLFQRGNGRAGKNAMIDISLEGLFEELKSSRELSEQRIQAISILELGELHGTPLGFTDAAVVMDNEIAFLAVAEQTDSTYTDGQYVGAMLGYLNSEGRLGKIVELNCPQKPEGIWLSSDSGCREFFVVTDADDRSQPSLLYRGML